MGLSDVAVESYFVFVRFSTQSDYLYMGQVDSGAEFLNWRFGEPGLVGNFSQGPSFQRNYQFRLYACADEGPTVCYGPFDTDGLVLYREGDDNEPTGSEDAIASDVMVLAQGLGGEGILHLHNLDPDLGERGAKIGVHAVVTDRLLESIGGGEGRTAYLASGDLNGDATPDILVSFGPVRDSANYPNTLVPLEGKTLNVLGGNITAFPQGFGGPAFYNVGEIHAAIGNFTGDEFNQIAVAQGNAGNDMIRLIQYDPEKNKPWTVVGFFPALNGKAASQNGDGGTTLSAGDLDGDGLDELIVGQSNGPDARTFLQILDINTNGQVERRLTQFAFPRNLQGNGGVRTVVADLDGDGSNELIAASLGNSRDHGDGRDQVRLYNTIAVLAPVVPNDAVVNLIRPGRYVWGVFTEEANPSGAIGIAAGELNQDTSDGQELAVTTNVMVEYNDFGANVILPASAPRYKWIKIQLENNQVEIQNLMEDYNGEEAFVDAADYASNALYPTILNFPQEEDNNN